jgi:hypothetical protein
MTHWTISLPGGICMSYIVLIWTSGDRCQAHVVRTSGDRCHVSNPTTQTHRVALARQNTLQKSFCAMNPGRNWPSISCSVCIAGSVTARGRPGAHNLAVA